MRTIPSRITVSIAAGAVAIGLFLTTMACGSSGSPTSPSNGGGSTLIVGSTGAAGASGATITITAAGLNPSSVTIAVGQSVTFVNNDNKSHEPASNPHPTHGSCPSIENTGTLAPGQTKLTQGFAGAGTCTFHDHLDNSNAAFQGTIRIQ